MVTFRLFASVIGTGLIAGVLVLAGPRTAHADQIEHAPLATVRFGDLNLDTRGGVTALSHRIELAATQVCQPTQPAGSLIASAAHRSCLRVAVSSAVRSVDSPALTAYFAARDIPGAQGRGAPNTASR